MTNMSFKTTNIPMTQAFQVSNRSGDSTVKISGSEIIGAFSIPTTAPTGLYRLFQVNPLEFTGTRVCRIASSYQKYRFTSLNLVLAANNSTTFNGSIVTGYSENPDFEITSAATAPSQIYALSDARISSLYTPVTVPARFNDKRWYNLDLDSEELMNTTQGAFCMAIVQTPSNTATLNIPVIMNYTIELKGTALQTIASNAVLFPAGDWTVASAPNMNFTVSPGETLPKPTLVQGKPYIMVPQADVISGVRAIASVVAYYGETTGYLFFTSLEAFNNSSVLTITQPFSTQRMQLSA